MTTIAPTRTTDQRTDALAKANRVRHVRARLKRVVAAKGSISGAALVADVVADPSEDLETMRVATLVEAVPRIGPTKLTIILRAVDVSPRKTLGGLSPRQRAALCRVLRGASG